MSLKENFEALKCENEALGLILEDQTAMIQTLIRTVKELKEIYTVVSKETNINSVKLDRFTDIIKK